MELPRRKGEDVYLPEGEFGRAVERLRSYPRVRDLRVGIVYAFDFRTRMLPFYYADKRMAPCSVRVLADVLNAAGFEHLRVVLQQWTPNFRPSAARLDGRPLDILLVSAMQVHADPARDLVRDAHRMGDARPLILAGGAKAIYEPCDYFELGPKPGVGADCSITGEAFVLLDLLRTVLEYQADGETARAAFDRAKRSGALADIPGLVYLSPDSTPARPTAINTGVQRLLGNLDELPMPDAGYRLLEPPHRGPGLKPEPCPPDKVGRKSPISSLIATHGCRFNCSYCSIPAANQRTWRYKSPKRLAAEIKHIHEQFGICTFFGTDDNFFNHRGTVESLMTELAQTESNGVPLGKKIRFYTEATQFDVHKNQDLLPLCRKGGLRGIWFGIEDLTAELVNKGQNALKTAEVFKLMHQYGIQPMVMMIHSDDQPLQSPRGDLSGLLNQARYVFDIGAVSYQCTYLGPAVGSRDYETAAGAKRIFQSVRGVPVPDAYQDGNHVVASHHPRPWRKQLNLLLTYATFYNPVNTLKTLFRMGVGRGSVNPKRFIFQLIGQVGLMLTVPRSVWWAMQLHRGPIKIMDGVPPARIPMIDAASGKQVNWGIDHPLPSEVPQETSAAAGTLEPQPVHAGAPTDKALATPA